MLFISKHYGLTANGLSGQQMYLALNHADMEFKNTNEQSYMNLKMVVLIVLAVFRRPNLVTFKIVQLIVNGLHGIRKAIAPDHVVVVNKYSPEEKKLNQKMEEDLVLEVIQRLKLAMIMTVLNQSIANGLHGQKLAPALKPVEKVSKIIVEENYHSLQMVKIA